MKIISLGRRGGMGAQLKRPEGVGEVEHAARWESGRLFLENSFSDLAVQKQFYLLGELLEAGVGSN